MVKLRLARTVSALALPFVLLGACGNPPTSQPSPSSSPTTPHAAAINRAALIGRWEVIKVTSTVSQHPEPLAVDHLANITFSPDGTAHGTDGVNGWSGKFVVEGATIRITDAMSTLIGLLSNAAQVRKDLQGAFAEALSSKPIRAAMVGSALGLTTNSYSLTLIKADISVAPRLPLAPRS